MIAQAIRVVAEQGGSLSAEEVESVVTDILDEVVAPSDVTAWLVALHARGETPEEIAGCVRAVLARRARLCPDLRGAIDIGGTGGDGAGTFNISTTAAFVVAGAGVPVLKHGNRGFTSRCGSADLMEGLGLRLSRRIDDLFVQQCLRHANMAYLFTPRLFRYPESLARVRREIGSRTLFNLAGPLCHPGGIDYQFLGVADLPLTETMARVLQRLGRRRAFVCSGLDGRLDEISISGATQASILSDGRIETRTLGPHDFDVRPARREDILGGDTDANVRISLSVLSGARGAQRDATVMCAGAALFVAGKTQDLQGGANLARQAIDSGAAMQAMERLRQAFNEM